MPGFIKALASNPRHLFGHANIFLFSHMRANTSLFGHILGSHPEVEGYYEMHIGYYSWRSLWRQKMLYFANHDVKPASHMVFDKLLHNYCVVSPDVLSRPSTKVIMALRAPERTIKSIVSLYQKINPAHEYGNPKEAAQYYIARLAELAKLGNSVAGEFFYMDAESLVDNPDETLVRLSDWLELKTPLSKEYRLFTNTAKGHFGDHSEAIKSGKITRSTTVYDSIEIPAKLLHEAENAYTQCRTGLIALSAAHLVVARHGEREP